MRCCVDRVTFVSHAGKLRFIIIKIVTFWYTQTVSARMVSFLKTTTDWMLELVPAVAGGISRVAALIQDADGQRPPCDQYADIVALGPMTDDMMSKFAQLERSARCKEDVLKLTKLFKSKREPLVKLKAEDAKATKDV